MSKYSLKLLSNGQLERTAEYFRALGEASRLRILQIINHGEISVNELAEKSKLSQSNVSRHLSVLVAAGILSKRKEGSHILYRISDLFLGEVISLVCKRCLNHKNHRDPSLGS